MWIDMETGNPSGVKDFRALDRKLPLVSLLMTTWNCREALKKTLKSVERQDYPSIEIVIKDGGSTDGTVDMRDGHSSGNLRRTAAFTTG